MVAGRLPESILVGALVSGIGSDLLEIANAMPTDNYIGDVDGILDC